MSQSSVNRKVKCARKNAPGNRSDIGWQHGSDVDGDAKKVKCNYCAKIVTAGISRLKHHLAGTNVGAEPCLVVPDDVKNLMCAAIDDAKEAAMKKRRLMQIDEEEREEGPEAAMEMSLSKGKYIMMSATKRKGIHVQTTMNLTLKKGLKDQIDDQVAKFFYTSAIPFNCIKNVEFGKMCEMIGRYGQGYKPPSYHAIREPLLKKAVNKTTETLEEFKKEWKKTGCTIMSDGRSICKFLVNSPKGTVFLYSLDTSDISKTSEKVFKMLNDVVETVGEENVVQVVTDNAANYKK